MKKIASVFLFIIILLITSLNAFAASHTVKIKITNPNSETNCKNKWCQVRVEIPAKLYMDKGWLREDLSNLEFRDPNYHYNNYENIDNSIGNGYDICRPNTQKNDLSWWVDAVKNGNFKIDRLPVWLLIYDLKPNQTRYIDMIINNDISNSEKLFANPRALVDFRSDSGWNPDGDCQDAEENNRKYPAKPGMWDWSVIGNSVFYFFAHGLWEDFIGWQNSGDANWNGYGVPQYGIDDDGSGSYGNAGFCNLWDWHAHCVRNLRVLSDIKYNPDKYKEVNTGENAFFDTPFTLSMKLYFKSTDVIKDWKPDYASYYGDSETNKPFFDIYFLTQLEGNSNYWDGGCNGDWHSQDGWRCSPNSKIINKFPGYKLVVYKPSDWTSYTDDSHFHRYHLKLKLYKKATKGSNWSKIAEFDYPIKEPDVTSKSGWFLYDATKHQLDIKVGENKIYIFLNGIKIGKVNRNDSWTKGAIGFDRKIWVTADWNDINEIMVRSFFKKEPKSEVYGNVDLEIGDDNSSYIGKNIIELSPDVQRVYNSIGGSTLDKYIFATYNIAREDQVREFKIKIRNRGDNADNVKLSFEINASPSNNDWVIYWCDENGNNCSANIPSSINVSSKSAIEKTVKVIPSPAALFQGGNIDIKIKALSNLDLSEDTVEINTRILPMLGCYWKYKIPIKISYNNPTSDSNYDLLRDYQVYVSLSGVNFSSSNEDGSDIIVTDSSGAKIPFWIKEFDRNHGKLKIWINVPEIRSGTDNMIYIWFGNKNLIYSYSDIKKTFDLWEDWKDYSPNLNDIKENSIGCPDGTKDCENGFIETKYWKNIPSSGQDFNWWFLYDRFTRVSEDGYSRSFLDLIKPVLVGDIYQLTPPNGESYPYNEQWPCKAPYKKSYGKGWHSCEWGPILRGGKAAWDHYEVAYLTLVHDNNYDNDFPNPIFNPAFMIDFGDLWGMEFFKPISHYSQFTFRPVSTGIDWVWQKMSKLPFNLEKDKWYWFKVRVYKYESVNGELKGHIEVKAKEAGNNLSDAEHIDIDDDSGFESVANFDVPSIFVLPRGSIGFSGWDGGWAIDDIRVRKYIDNGPQCNKQNVEELSPREKISLSQPQITPPYFEGKAAYVVSETTPFSWLGEINIYYADCYINGECDSEAGEDQNHIGTISVFGKIDDDTPKGLGYYLMKAEPGENNRYTIDDSNWLTDGRVIFTHLDNLTSHAYNNFDKFDLSNCDNLTSYLGTSGTCNADDNFLDETEKLIKFVRGFYIPDFPKSVGRDKDSIAGYGDQDNVSEDNEQWKLGDILHSNPLIVGIPNMYYADDSYADFVNNHRDRPLVTYFMSNEGVVHAFELARYDSESKRYKPLTTPIELWSYLPEGVLKYLKDTTGASHHYMADGLLRAIDVQDNSDNWKTVLIGLSGKEKKYMFAIDITDPTNPKFLWEKNYLNSQALFDKLGTTISSPALGKLGDEWVTIFGSGYSENFIENYTIKKAHITIVNILTGDLIKQIKVSDKIGNVITNITSNRDVKGNIEYIFFGDYYGVLWRISAERLKSLNDNAILDESDMLFKPIDYDTSATPSEVKRPITVSPVIAKDSNGDWWVYFGTGDYDEYNPNYPYQRFYGLKNDGSTTYSDGASVNGEPVNNIVDMTNSASANANNKSWFIELGHNDNLDQKQDGTASEKDNNERVLQSAEVYGGFVFFTTYQPINNPCGGGKSRFYAVGFTNGKAVADLFAPSGTPETIRSLELSGKGVPSKPMIYTGKSGKSNIVATGLVNSSDNKLEKINLNPEKFIEHIDIKLWRRVR